MVPVSTIIILAFDLLFGIAVPILLAIFLKKKFHLTFKPFLIGCAVWFVFVMILEKMFHTAILSSPVGATIQGTTWMMALYGGLAAGIFEEGGRFIAMKTVLKNEHKDDHNALMYGAGHGGFEAMFLLGIGMVNNLIYAIMNNTGHIGLLTAPLNETQLATFQYALNQLINSPWTTFLAAPVERVSAMIFHIALSVLVWQAVTMKKFWFFPLAIFLHFAMDAGTVMMSRNGVSILWIEIAVFVFAVACAYFCLKPVFCKKAEPEPSVSEPIE